jgi:cytochrome P450
MATEIRELTFDVNGLSSAENPYPVYRRLRDESPVHHCHDGDQSMWLLSRYDDVAAALADWHTFTSVGSMTPLRSAPGARSADGEQLITTDPPFHDGLRQVIREYFSPKRIALLEAKITREVVDRLEPLRSRGKVDVAHEFAWPFALAIISDMLGIPEDERAGVMSLYVDLEYREPTDDAGGQLARYIDYFEALATERLAEPRDDLISVLMRAVTRAEITRADAVMLSKDLFEGGIDVPANLVANSMLALAEHPDQRALVGAASETARLRLAVEELARYESPIQRIPRRTTSSVMIHETVIPKGATVLLLLGSANHDERRFIAADTLDVSRPPARNVAFGAGVHFCIGAPLARVEARIALSQLLTAIPEYHVASRADRPRASHVMRALLNLQLNRDEGRP